MAQPRGKTICQGPAFLKEEERTIIVFFSLPFIISKWVQRQRRAGPSFLGRAGPVWGRGETKNKMKRSIAKGLSEFCVAAAYSWG